MKTTRNIMYLFVTCLLASCAVPRASIKQGYDFSAIRTVKVDSFYSGATKFDASRVVADEFVRQMLGLGFNVRNSSSDSADAVLSGSVTQFLPNRRFLMPNRNKINARREGAHKKPVELSGSSVYNDFNVSDGSKVIVSNATVGISANLKDAKTGDIIWSNSYTYEGIDLNAALEGAVMYLLQSMPGTPPAK